MARTSFDPPDPYRTAYITGGLIIALGIVSVVVNIILGATPVGWWTAALLFVVGAAVIVGEHVIVGQQRKKSATDAHPEPTELP
ncbi:hypothetical protein [Leifsonia poae]|uniref:hypothetical protein n=1 Tax=Leifsonia poae TaxID=110933 RepID=UPI003D674901